MSSNDTLAAGEQTDPGASAQAALPVSPGRWILAAIKTTRPRQWPKNLLVFAAPLAGASLGHGFGYALLAMVGRGDR
jgi:decaprenyl-phosphate phosphoribosyltransferase